MSVMPLRRHWPMQMVCLQQSADALRQPMTWLPHMRRKRTMHRKPLIVSSLIFALATSACTSVGKRPSPPQSCPRPPLPAASLMVEPTTELKVRAELLAPPPSATPR
ncbi:gp12.1 [Stenotrophomonas phage S1]|uniref:Rz.1 like protein n=1 Tax=Stenotrophomonas phage S1 TaxID=573591 RepID=UPI000185A057|nr:Rz.1 like protein [Stenotrophomonas phage S1]ACJ24737.1 gp12.1 [Stenotrophomonas phage S1]